MLPTSMYGVTKLAGELLCNYYHSKYGLDVRSVRYPGIISSETLPGGGTTDYAVEIFYQALTKGRYACFLREDTCLPCLHAIARLRDGPVDSPPQDKGGTAVASMSFRLPSNPRLRRYVPALGELNPTTGRGSQTLAMSLDDSGLATIGAGTPSSTLG
jgi:hypothetical protein